MQPPQSLRQLPKSFLLDLQPPLNQLTEVSGGFSDKVAAGKSPFRDQLCRSARSGRPQIGHKIADRKINFMANRRDDRQGGMEDGAGDDLFIESPQIFQAAAAARQ